jgi:hypothetical protein
MTRVVQKVAGPCTILSILTFHTQYYTDINRIFIIRILYHVILLIIVNLRWLVESILDIRQLNLLLILFILYQGCKR